MREAAVPVGAIGVQDLQVDLPTRRPESVLGHDDLDALADDLAAESDPVASDQLEAYAARLDERPVEGAPRTSVETGRFDDDEQGSGSPGERRQSADRVGSVRGRSPLSGRSPVGGPSTLRSTQVRDKHVDGPCLEQRSGHREALVEMLGREDDEPLQVDAPGDRLDRIERPRRVEVRHDRSARLRLGTQPQRQRRLAARDVALQRRGRRPRQASRPEDRVERGEARRDDRTVERPVAWLRPPTRIRRIGPRRIGPRRIGRREPTAAPAQRPAPPLLGEVGDRVVEGQRGSTHETSHNRTSVRLRQGALPEFDALIPSPRALCARSALFGTTKAQIRAWPRSRWPRRGRRTPVIGDNALPGGISHIRLSPCGLHPAGATRGRPGGRCPSAAPRSPTSVRLRQPGT
jgi:hypothetical protein